MSEFAGRWRIQWMETWSQEYVDKDEPGYFEFDDQGLGSFLFGTIHGVMDCRVAEDEPLLEFSWLGDVEGNQLFGRGYFRLVNPAEGEGVLFIHTGGKSGVSIRREV